MLKNEKVLGLFYRMAGGAVWLALAGVLSGSIAAVAAAVAGVAGIVEANSHTQDAVLVALASTLWAVSCMLIGYRAGRDEPCSLTEPQADALKRFVRMALVWVWLDTDTDARIELRKLAKEAGLVRVMDRGASGEPATYEGLVRWLM